MIRTLCLQCALVVALTTTLAAQEPLDLKQLGLRGNIISIVSTWTAFETTDGVTVAGGTRNYFTQWFDRQGRIIKETGDGDDGTAISTSIYSYDTNGRIENIQRAASDPSENSRTEYVYNERGRLQTVREVAESDDRIKSRIEYVYDVRGVRQSATEYRLISDGTPKVHLRRTFRDSETGGNRVTIREILEDGDWVRDRQVAIENGDGRLITVSDTTFEIDGRVSMGSITFFNERGWPIREEVVYDDEFDRESYVEEFDYKTDANGNWLVQDEYRTDRMQPGSKRVLENRTARTYMEIVSKPDRR